MTVNLRKVAKKAKKYRCLLIVLRHAKTEQFNSDGDFERKLTDKGFNQAKKVAKGLARMGLIPDRIVSSSAVRARQTVERMLKVFGDKPEIDLHKSLYDLGTQAVFEQLASCKEKTGVLVVVGHEPTMSMACQWIASSNSDKELLDLLNVGLSPASVVLFGEDKPFSKWQIHSADLLAVIKASDFD